jgi:MarR family transcriptional regulator, organic hydroperoxide resistance regulator
MIETLTDRRLAASLGYALARVFRQVNRASGRALSRFGLSAEQGHILLVLWLEGPMNVGRLRRVLMLSSATLTGALDRMEKQGFVRRVPDPDDRRAFRVEPSGFDARRRRAIEAALAAIETDCFAALGSRDRRELLRMLHTLSAALPD